MSSPENMNMPPMGSAHGSFPAASMPETMQPAAAPPAAAPPAVTPPAMQETATYAAVYPEVYYKLRPYILMECDILDSCGAAMPTQQQVEQMADYIFEHACTMYPDMGDYLRKCDGMKDDPPDDSPFPRGGFRPGFGFRPFRRRGLGRDLIEALLLAELFGRRRYYY